MPNYDETVRINRPWSDWIFLNQTRDRDGGGFHIHNPWGNSTQPQGAADRNRLEIAYHTAAGQDLWGQIVLHGPSGNVGLGLGAPQARLDVNGNVIVRGDVYVKNSAGTNTIHLDASEGDIKLAGADCAEDFPAAECEGVDAGSVMVIGDAGLVVCAAAYDRRVAGVVSGAGEFKPGIRLGAVGNDDDTLPLALVGRVRCKVDASHGPIAVGDLLTTSPTPGHAMRADDPTRAFGAVLGKAMEPLAEGQGMITILVCLN